MAARMRGLVTGASGLVGAYLLRELAGRGVRIAGWSGTGGRERFGVALRPVDVADGAAVEAAFVDASPDVVIHGGAVSKPALAFGDPERARAVNVDGTRRLAELADRRGARLVLLSTDMVFDGERGGYTEDEEPNPRSVYGKSKLEAESIALGLADAAVLRLSLLVGPSLVADRPTLFDQQVAALRRGEPVRVFHDEWRTPLDLPTAARAIAATAFSDAGGLFHLGGPRRLSRLDMGRVLADVLGANPGCLHAASRLSVEADEPRPRDLSLDSTRWAARFPGVPRPEFPEAVRAML